MVRVRPDATDTPICTPSRGAVEASVTRQPVAVGFAPVKASHCSEEMEAVLPGVTVIDKVRVDCPSVAVRVAVWTAPISPVAVMVKVAEVEPAAIITDPGTINCVGKLLDKAIAGSLLGAGDTVTVQLEDDAALSVVLSHCREMPPGVLVDLRVTTRDTDELPTAADTVTN